MADKTGRESDKFMLRLPDGLRDRIKEKADANARSMNAEIVQVLEREYPEPTDHMYLVLDDIRRTLDEYEKESDPKRRLWLQTTVEGLASGNVTIDWGEASEDH